LNKEVRFIVTFRYILRFSIVDFLVKANNTFLFLLALAGQFFMELLSNVLSHCCRTVFLTLINQYFINSLLITPWEWGESIWDGTDLDLFSIEYCTLWAFKLNSTSSNSLRFTHRSWSTPVSNGETRYWVRFLSNELLTCSKNKEKWKGEQENPEEHSCQTGQYIEIGVNTISKNKIWLFNILLWER
jgi:hypothetical protein